MKLLTEAIKSCMPPLYSTEDISVEEKVVQVKFFDPTGAATWLIVEGTEYPDGDWIFFGWADLFGDGSGAEWGYISLDELESVKGRFGLGIERDLHFGNPKFGETEESRR